MIDQILTYFGEVFRIIGSSSTIIYWFTLTAILVGVYAFATNHLSFQRLGVYALLFLILLIGIEGPKFGYSMEMLNRQITDRGLWLPAIFEFYFFLTMMIGLTAGFVVNKALEFFFGDYWKALSRDVHRFADRLEKRSPTYSGQVITSWESLQRLALEKQAAKLAADQQVRDTTIETV